MPKDWLGNFSDLTYLKRIRPGSMYRLARAMSPAAIIAGAGGLPTGEFSERPPQVQAPQKPAFHLA
jgi:hypothetical protein